MSFKKLVPGTVVLGQVSSINAYDISLSLPNSLTGYISITNISEQISKKLDEIENRDDDDEENDGKEQEIDENKLPDLKSLFKIGQWLRAVVTERESTASSNAAKSKKKHIALTIKPEVVNSVIEKDDLSIRGLSVQASIQSIEDHGAILDIGFPELSGFISSKELGHAGYKSEFLFNFDLNSSLF